MGQDKKRGRCIMLTQHIQKRVNGGIMAPVVECQENYIIICFNRTGQIKFFKIFFRKSQRTAVYIYVIIT